MMKRAAQEAFVQPDNLFVSETDPRERLFTALAALKAVSSLLSGQKLEGTMDTVKSEDLNCLLMLIGGELQAVHNSQRGGLQ